MVGSRNSACSVSTASGSACGHVDTGNGALERGSRKEEAVGVIHNLATQQKVLSTTAMVVNVDFGSASPAALVAMLQAIQQVADKLAVKQVLCSAPSTTRFARDPSARRRMLLGVRVCPVVRYRLPLYGACLVSQELL